VAKRRSFNHTRIFMAMLRLDVATLETLRDEIEVRMIELTQLAKEQEEQRQAKENAITEATRAAVVGEQPAKGYVETKLINGGSYRYLRYWEAGKLKSKYLGKAEQT
jgi:hypothetical protein